MTLEFDHYGNLVVIDELGDSKILAEVDVDKKTIDFNGLSINQVDFKKLYKIMTRIMESMDELPAMGTSPLDCY